MRRNVYGLTLCAMLLALCSVGEAQPAKKVFRIGLLSGNRSSPMPPQIEALRQGLRKLGYVEGQNISVEYRFTEGKEERYANLAAELVGLAVDVIFTQGTAATLAAKQATNTIPIVVGGAGDLVGEGLVSSLARPGGNVTGFTNVDPDLSAKRLQLLGEAFPKISRVAVLYHGGPGGDQEEPPNVRIDVACGEEWKAGREREKGSESTTNGRVSQSGSTKVSESGVAIGGGSGAGVGSIELVSLSMEQALW